MLVLKIHACFVLILVRQDHALERKNSNLLFIYKTKDISQVFIPIAHSDLVMYLLNHWALSSSICKQPEGVPPILVLSDVIDIDIPDLLGLDILDSFGLMAENVTNRLWHRIRMNEDPVEYYDE